MGRASPAGGSAASFVEGVSTPKVEDLLRALVLTGIDKSQVWGICKSLDVAGREYRNRPLEGHYPYVWLDALHLKILQNHPMVSLAGVIAISVNEHGEREILGSALGGSENETFWLNSCLIRFPGKNPAFLTQLTPRSTA